MSKLMRTTAATSEVVEGVDQDALRQAEAMLGTSSPRDAVNEALRELVRRRLVTEYFDFLAALPLTDPEDLRAQAWRSKVI